MAVNRHSKNLRCHPEQNIYAVILSDSRRIFYTQTTMALSSQDPSTIAQDDSKRRMTAKKY